MCQRTRAKATTSTLDCSRKSTKVDPTDASGRISRGNQTFLTSGALPTTDPTAAAVAFWNRLKTSTPDMRNRAKSGMELGRITLKMIENTAIVTAGLTSDHRNPRTLFLYRTLRSLRTRLARSSRYAAMSATRDRRVRVDPEVRISRAAVAIVATSVPGAPSFSGSPRV